jgi:holo-[acyl-carrier protein] synthase
MTKSELGLAIGNDLIYLPNFAKSHNPLSIERAYTPLEIAYCQSFADPILRFASTWAGKEAVYKALKQCDGSLSLWWRDIEILRDKPRVHVAKARHPYHYSLTITHDGEYIWAMALVIES